MLKDPITGYPVAIVEKNIIKNIISKEKIDKIQKMINGKNLLSSDNNDDIFFKLIPYSSIGKSNRINFSF